MSTARIASVYFYPVHADRSTFGHGPYDIPAVPRGADPIILELTDKVQVEEGPYILGQGGKRQKRRYLINAGDIARDLVNEWAASGHMMTPECHPGIFMVRETIPLIHEGGERDGQIQMDAEGKALYRDATAAEKKQMWDEDLAAAHNANQIYGHRLIQDATAFTDGNPKRIPLVPPPARAAATHFGVVAPWMREGAALDVVNCPMCTRSISKEAVVCPHCQQVVDMDRWAEREALKGAAIKQAKTNASQPAA
jgi:endogenous inhibitor of DNA gyrase (YacG/DUF329 family)